MNMNARALTYAPRRAYIRIVHFPTMFSRSRSNTSRTSPSVWLRRAHESLVLVQVVAVSIKVQLHQAC